MKDINQFSGNLHPSDSNAVKVKAIDTYLEAGLPLLPVKRNKKPDVPSDETWKRDFSLQELLASDNIGIKLGQSFVSRVYPGHVLKLTVINFNRDDPDVFKRFRMKLHELKIDTSTVIVKSGGEYGGYHLYFLQIEDQITFKNSVTYFENARVDLRVEDYIIAPPSVVVAPYYFIFPSSHFDIRAVKFLTMEQLSLIYCFLESLKRLKEQQESIISKCRFPLGDIPLPPPPPPDPPIMRVPLEPPTPPPPPTTSPTNREYQPQYTNSIIGRTNIQQNNDFLYQQFSHSISNQPHEHQPHQHQHQPHQHQYGVGKDGISEFGVFGVNNQAVAGGVVGNSVVGNPVLGRGSESVNNHITSGYLYSTGVSHTNQEGHNSNSLLQPPLPANPVYISDIKDCFRTMKVWMRLLEVAHSTRYGQSHKIMWDESRGISDSFLCPIHTEANPSVHLFRNDAGEIVMSDHHRKQFFCDKSIYAIQEVFSVLYGTPESSVPCRYDPFWLAEITNQMLISLDIVPVQYCNLYYFYPDSRQSLVSMLTPKELFVLDSLFKLACSELRIGQTHFLAAKRFFTDFCNNELCKIPRNHADGLPDKYDDGYINKCTNYYVAIGLIEKGVDKATKMGLTPLYSFVGHLQYQEVLRRYNATIVNGKRILTAENCSRARVVGIFGEQHANRIFRRSGK